MRRRAAALQSYLFLLLHTKKRKIGWPGLILPNFKFFPSLYMFNKEHTNKWQLLVERSKIPSHLLPIVEPSVESELIEIPIFLRFSNPNVRVTVKNTAPLLGIKVIAWILIPPFNIDAFVSLPSSA